MLGVETLDRRAGTELAPVNGLHLPVSTGPRRARQRKRDLQTVLLAALQEAIGARRLFVLLPFAMIGGLICYVQVPFEPQLWALVGVGSALLLALLVLRHSRLFPAMGLLATFWFGVMLLPLHGTWFGTEMLVRPAYGAFEGHVDEIVSATPEARRIIVSGLVPYADDRAVPIARARLVVPPEPPLAPGDIVRGKMRLAPVPGPVLPGTFDGQFHAYFAGIGAYGAVSGDFELVATGSELDATRAIEGLRMAIGARIDAELDGASAAIGRAMVMGDQSAITDETREVMANSGLAHIYSISGLHLSIVAGGVFWLLRLGLASTPILATRWSVKKVAAVGGLIAATGYMLLAGGVSNVPALRSAIMLGLIFGAVLAGRRALTMRNVAIAALAIILIDPASVFRASFQLSFAAVVALIGVYEIPRQKRNRDRKWVSRLGMTLWATAATSFIAGTATMLFAAYHFQQTAPLGVVANVLVLPVVSLVIMPFAVISVLAMPFGIEGPFVAIMGWGIDRMVDGAMLVAGWSAGITGNPLLTSSALVIGLAALAWFALFNSWWRMAGPVLAVPLIFLTGFDQRPDLLIADTTQAVALRTTDQVGLIAGRTGSFAVDVWSDFYQEEIAATAPGVACDNLGCIATTERFSVAVVRNAAALAEDCGQHDLLIARMTLPAVCKVGQTIDATDLAAGGVHWLRWNGAAARFDIRTAIPNVTRPWRVAPQ